MKTNLIGIHTMSISTEIMEFAQTGNYQTIPMIIYNINGEKTNGFYLQRPIKIFSEEMYYHNFQDFIPNELENTGFFSIPGKAYNKMQQYANNNINKVLADMLTHVIVKVIGDLKEKNSDARNIFFIDSSDTNKLIGRLGYIYLDHIDNTIAFVTYKTGGLLTDILNAGNTKLKLDINYFKDENHRKNSHSEIIPNDFMESLTQTVFFNIPNREAVLSPLRCDILSQGISTSEIQKKVNQLNDILTDSEHITLPFSESDGKNPASMWIRIPRVLNKCLEAVDLYRSIAERIMEDKEWLK